MFDVPYEKMVCDSDLGDGGLYFYEEYMEWVLRNSNSGFKIYYKDIQDVKIIYTRKKELHTRFLFSFPLYFRNSYKEVR